jgi:hypothetical protein
VLSVTWALGLSGNRAFGLMSHGLLVKFLPSLALVLPKSCQSLATKTLLNSFANNFDAQTQKLSTFVLRFITYVSTKVGLGVSVICKAVLYRCTYFVFSTRAGYFFT